MAAHYHIPKQIITNLYKKLEGKVVTKEWESEVFAGDSFSGVIFLVVFNPIIEYIKRQKKANGYYLTTKTSVRCVATTQFAKDFNCISKDIIKHQTLVMDVEQKLISKRLIVKPSKSRSFNNTGRKIRKYSIQIEG